ncbi:MAG: hypothetical protein VX663_06335, partial [Pseudomonadota bacterium]|nr:hypothetical protein [Pseudomonadota bacterium]
MLLDDVKRDPRAAYATVLQFLAVRDDGRVDFPVANPAKRRRFPLLRRGMIAVARLRESLRVPTLGLGIYRWVDQRNLEYRPRAPVADQLRKELVDYYREDVALL